MNTQISNLIKKLRLNKKFSQGQVAKAVGVSRPTYMAIESGKNKFDIEVAEKLAGLFGIGVDTLMSGSIPDLTKYKHMIISYLRMNLSADGKIPKTKLAKLLYLADFSWFYNHLESMSGMQYRKIPYGPVPDSFFRALDELEYDGKIVVERKSSEGKDMFLIKESESNKNEKILSLSKEENLLIKKIAIKWKHKKTNEIVNFTHNQLPYFLCKDNELIPYELITQEDPDKVY
jgi:transcriptional regulator with XRE-family HTH domain